jgi:hypothetical protein
MREAGWGWQGWAGERLSYASSLWLSYVSRYIT